MGIPSTLHAPMGSLKYYGGRKAGLLRCSPKKAELPSLCWSPLNACGPMLAQSCTMCCDDCRLREELVECHIGSFVQVHIETFFCDLIRLDLQSCLAAIWIPFTYRSRGSSDDEGLRSARSHLLLGYLLHMHYAI